MTQAQAATVVAALTNQGYLTEVAQRGDDGWIVVAKSPQQPVDIAVANTFAINQGVKGKVGEVIFY